MATKKQLAALKKARAARAAKYSEGAFSSIVQYQPTRAQMQARRKRGRPKGSKSKQYHPTRAHFQPHLVTRRKRGRPKGSKNKVNKLVLSAVKGKRFHISGNVELS